MKIVSFNPKEITKRVLSDLPDRSRDVIEKRYGLAGNSKTLEAIGQSYGITRERVRQIENLAKDQIRKSESFIKHAQHAVDELHGIVTSLGGIAQEKHLLDTVSPDDHAENHIYLLLDLADPFSLTKEDDNFYKTWSTNHNNHKQVKKSLKKLYEDLDSHEIISEEKIIERFLEKLEFDLIEGSVNDDLARRWLEITKKVDQNKLGQWGRTDSSNISTRGVRDMAYLILRQNGKPMHFRDIAEVTGKEFGKRINTATMHNELIKDARFDLVGRGLYALKEWGLYGGTVAELITEILKKAKALSEKDVIKTVLERKIVKESTIKINLKNKKLFTQSKEDRKYRLAKKK